MVTPSNEFRSGGPVKQNLTSHVGPTTLAVRKPWLAGWPLFTFGAAENLALIG